MLHAFQSEICTQSCMHTCCRHCSCLQTHCCGLLGCIIVAYACTKQCVCTGLAMLHSTVCTELCFCWLANQCSHCCLLHAPGQQLVSSAAASHSTSSPPALHAQIHEQMQHLHEIDAAGRCCTVSELRSKSVQQHASNNKVSHVYEKQFQSTACCGSFQRYISN